MKKPAKLPILIEAFGGERTISEWADDHRCKVVGNTLRYRLNNG